MNEWKKSYSKSNWSQQREEKEDEKREQFLKDMVQMNIIKLEANLTDRERLKVLNKINDAFNDLRIEAFDYDEEEAEFIKAQIEKTKWKILEEENKNASETKSWDEFKEEESKSEKEER